MKTFITNLTDIAKSPLSILTLIAVVILIIVFIKIKKVKLTTKILVQVALAVALSTILSFIKFYHFPQGGSINLASMVPILVMAIIYGPEIGFLTGFVYGIVDLILGPYILNPIQVLFDYPLPYMALGLAGYFKNNKTFAVIVAMAGRFIFHFISGVVFFGSFAPDGMSPIIYSAVTNALLIVPNGLICLIVIYLIPIDRLKKI
ncbi:hypothetical protein CM240_2601 [Clostridium bornimense]|uniref:Proton-coupled thiamine transporter YuaJ n=1 Tax=Clostridium bornimense TaxID=1216932 RepID=W6SJ62_9CLOT|nr:energy-coupled thiamine transporter ThiT [Clostridium bornimense]CDM69725.1 hypothetical protein CM240_2601 [Clostridium bornimense]